MEFYSENETKDYLNKQKEKLQRLIAVVQDFKNFGNSESEDDIENYITRFLIIRSCGYIEEVYRRSICLYVEKRAGKEIRNLIFNAKFRKGANPTQERIVETLRDLDPGLKNSFLSILGDNENLKSLITMRNTVAHGGSDRCTRRQAIEKGNLAITIGDWFLENLF